MKRILIVEDNKTHMDALGQIVGEIPDVTIDKAYSAQEAYGMLFSRSYNLFLVDIILNTDKKLDVSGMELVRKLRELKQYQFTPIIFVTTLEDPKLCAFKELHCYDYIEKPFSKEQVKNVVMEALTFPESKEIKEFAYFRKDGILYSVKISNIKYILVDRKGVNIHTKVDCLRIGYLSMSDILIELDSEDFIKCSRNALVNKKYIEYVDYTNGYLKLLGDNNRIEIGSVFKKNLRERGLV